MKSGFATRREGESVLTQVMADLGAGVEKTKETVRSTL